MMIQLPSELLNSLIELGLLESEAKIYAALVLLQSAEVRDLLDCLDVSKPRIYDGLRVLKEKGLITLTSPRPATYQAVEPKIALDIILKKHEDASKEAVKQFEVLKKQEIATKPTSPLWFIFGGKSLEFKIKDMLKNAKESIYCQTSCKYIDYLEPISKKNIPMFIIVMVDNKDTNKKLERLSIKSNVKITIIEKNQMMNSVEMAKHKSEMHKQSQNNIMDLWDLDNLFKLVVDDSELLTVPPLKGDSLSAMTSTNKALVFNEKMEIEEALLAYKSDK